MILPLLFRGTAVHCPCCDHTFRRFIRRYRWDALCPGCLSLSRHRLLWLYLRSQTDLLDRSRALLHLAPEEALVTQLTAAPLRYVRADLHPTSADVMTADITDMPFDDEEFEAVLCNHVLEHVVDDRKAMAELHRVLKPGGRLYMLQPVRLKSGETYEDPSVTAPSERYRLFGQRDHVRIYGRDLIARLEGVGFDVTLEHPVRRLPPGCVELYGLLDETIFVCRKPAGS
jgi:SAM-dependent methyltransferase